MATAPVDNWTEDKCIQLIREYRARPLLWDSKNPLFFKKPRKPMAWESIGKALDLHADTCKHKMVILMSSFRREKAKILHSIKDGDPSKMYTSTWFAFEEMSFLMDKDTERERQQSNISGPYETGEMYIQDVIEDGEPTPKKQNQGPKRMDAHLAKRLAKYYSRRKPSLPRDEEPVTIETPAPPPPAPVQVTPGPSVTSESEEEIKAFTNFILNKMKKYTETTKNAVQQAICDIIFRADQNFYESGASAVGTSVTSDPLMKSIQIDNESIIIKQDYSDSD